MKHLGDEQLQKLALAQMILDQVKYYQEEIRDKDGDELYCCNGEYCACGGMTNRDHWKLIAGVEEPNNE